MANIGIARASYYADTSIHRLNRDLEVSVGRVASAKKNLTASDVASLKSMDYSFQLDFAATKAAVKSMSVTQAYLSTAISSLDSSSAILAKIHELAVLGANGSNSDADQASLNAEAEILADEFHKAMQVSNFKGRVVLDGEDAGSKMSLGRSSAQTGNFGLGEVDYDFFYDYDNPGLTSLNSGVKYEIKRELTAVEKAAILTRTDGLDADQLVKGFQFKTNEAPSNNVGNGTISLNPNDRNTHDYRVGTNAQRFDVGHTIASPTTGASATGLTADFKGGTVDIEISENYENADNLTIANFGDLSISNGKVFYTDRALAGAPTIEFGEVDSVKNGLNGTSLRINLHADATIPGTSNLKNGDFDDTINEVKSYRETFATQNRTENRNGVLNNLTDANVPPNAITIVANMVGATYQNVTLTGGSGTGARVHIKTAVDGLGNENITEIQFLDKGKNYQVGDSIFVPNGTGAIGNTEIKVAGILDNQTVTLTVPIINNTTANATWGAGESGSYNFDASGDPNGVPKLTYGPGDIKKENYSTMVPNPAGVITDPETGQRTNDVQQWNIRNVTTVTGTTYGGERTLTDQVSTGYTPNRTDTVPEYWSTYNKRVDFGQNFTLDLFPTDAIKADPLDQANELDAANGTVDTSGRTQISVPTPTEAQMAATAAGSGNDNAGLETALNTVQNNMRVTVNGGKLNLNTSEFWFNNPAGKFGVLHGPAAVSDVFTGKAGQFLKLDYTATGTGDDYHVAGYIYKVNPDGSPGGAPIIALNETGTSVNDRASVEIPDNGDYRFVFVVGTYDKTGGRKAGADMTIDNIVAEDPYTTGTGAINALLKALHYENTATAASATKKLTATVSTADKSTVLTDDAIINMIGFDLTQETNGPYMIAPTLNLVSTPSDGETQSADILTAKIEKLQARVNASRVQAAAQYNALASAMESSTDLRSQFALASGTLSDLNFSRETAHLTKIQIQQDIATSMLAQANQEQSNLMMLVAE